MNLLEPLEYQHCPFCEEQIITNYVVLDISDPLNFRTIFYLCTSCFDQNSICFELDYDIFTPICGTCHEKICTEDPEAYILYIIKDNCISQYYPLHANCCHKEIYKP